MDIDQARENMITQQVRTWDVNTPSVLELLRSTPRERFVPTEYLQLPFADISIPIGHGRMMLPPKEEAKIIDALAVKGHDHVLEIGTGAGYLTALLAKQADKVISLDSVAAFSRRVTEILSELDINNVECLPGSLDEGWQEYCPYDVIMLNGSLAQRPVELLQALKVGGRLFVVLGEEPRMRAVMFTRSSKDSWQEWQLFETVRPRLLSMDIPKSFRF